MTTPGTATGSRWRHLGEHVLVAVAATATAVAYDGMFVDRFHLVAAGAASLAVCLTLWAIGPRLRTVGALVLVAVAVIAAALVAVAAVSPSGDGVIDTLANAWGRTLSTAVPLGHEDGFLVLPTALTATAAAAMAIVVQRSPHPAMPLVPLVGALAVGLVVAAPGRPPAGPLAVAVTVSAVALCALRAAPDRPARARPVVALAVVALVACAAAGATMATETLRETATPALRDLTGPVEEDVRALSPLVDFKADLQREPPLPLLEVRGDPVPGFVRLASFDTHDGIVWSTSGRFERTATEIALPPWMSGAGVERGTWTFELDGLDEVFLPTIGEPLAIDGTEARVDVTAGDLLAVDPDRTYAVTAALPPGDGAALDDAAIATDPSLDRYLTLPDGLPLSIERQARRLAGTDRTGGGGIDGDANDGSAHERLTAMADGLRDEHGYNESVPAGHGLAQIERFLVQQADRVDKLSRRGTAEQFATSYVLMARSLDVPARLAVGFRVGSDAADPGAGDGGTGARGTADGDGVTLSSADLHVWAEVPFEGLGWVPFDPTPERRQTDPPQLPGADAPDAATAFIIEDPGAELSQPLLDLESGGDAGLAPVDGTALAGLAVLVLAVGVLAVIVLVKQRRRIRRRGAPRPAERIVGAWDDVRDRLVELGFGRRRHLSASELADAAPPFVGADAAGQLVRLAPLVDLALYGGELATPAQAESAWVLADEFGDALRAGRSWPRRLAARLDPRPLVGRRR